MSVMRGRRARSAGRKPTDATPSGRDNETVLVHPWDAPLDVEEIWAFVRDQGFGHRMAPGRRGLPVVERTQFIVAAADEPNPDVLSHVAPRRPVWRAIGENPTVLMSHTGDWAF